MKILKNDSQPPRPILALGVLPIFILLIAAGCVPQPTASVVPPENPLPSLTPVPSLTITPTLQVDNDLVYIVVGLYPDQHLPLYQEPSLSAEIIGQIPPAGKSIQSTGAEQLADGIAWLQVVYQEVAGWVDSSYLAHQHGDIPEELVALAQATAAALKSANYDQLESFVHPDQCLRFAPYINLQDSDQVFCPGQLAALPGSDTLYTWGVYDGSGEPILLSFDDYHQRFVYDQDFFQPEVVGLNQEVSSGNIINNISDIFPDGMIVEYHFSGFDPQYGGMDWRSLQMVFVEEQGVWYLAALAHGEWTI